VDRRDVFFSAWPGYPAAAGLRFEPVGLFQQLRPSRLPPRQVDQLWASYGEASVREESARVGSLFGRGVAARYPLMRGERALFEGHGGLAIEAFELAGRVAQESEATHISLGAIYGRGGDYGRAIREFEVAIRIQPVSVRAWNNLGLARSLAGDVAGARRAWTRSLEILPDQPEARQQLDALAR
jgi:Flp pilus assembly protein TadD